MNRYLCQFSKLSNCEWVCIIELQKNRHLEGRRLKSVPENQVAKFNIDVFVALFTPFSRKNPSSKNVLNFGSPIFKTISDEFPSASVVKPCKLSAVVLKGVKRIESRYAMLQLPWKCHFNKRWGKGPGTRRQNLTDNIKANLNCF